MLSLNDEAAFILVCILLDDIRQVHVRGVLHIFDVTDVVQKVFDEPPHCALHLLIDRVNGLIQKVLREVYI